MKKIISKFLHKWYFKMMVLKTKNRFIEPFLRLAQLYYRPLPLYKGEMQGIFKLIYHHHHWMGSESRSGMGSSLESTTVIRRILPKIIDRYSIKSILDVPCGDFYWMKDVEKNFLYIGGDIVPDIIHENQKKYSSGKVCFIEMDITTGLLPATDLIFCRDCLQHLSFENIQKALSNFLCSGAKYLLVTSYPYTLKNYDMCDGEYFPINLRKPPFNFPKPLQTIQEKAPNNEIDKTMLLYKISDLNRLTFYSITKNVKRSYYGMCLKSVRGQIGPDRRKTRF